MTISEKTAGDATVVVVEGKVDTKTSPDMHKFLDDLREAGKSKLLIDFTAVPLITSAGLRVLLATAKEIRGSGGQLRLCALNDVVAEVFNISGFNTIFEIFADEATALEGF